MTEVNHALQNFFLDWQWFVQDSEFKERHKNDKKNVRKF